MKTTFFEVVDLNLLLRGFGFVQVVLVWLRLFWFGVDRWFTKNIFLYFNYLFFISSGWFGLAGLCLIVIELM